MIALSDPQRDQVLAPVRQLALAGSPRLTSRLLTQNERKDLIYIKARFCQSLSIGAMEYTAQKAIEVSGSGKATLPAYWMLVLTLIGIAVAVYVARGNYTGQPLWCPIIDGCNAVVNSPYSRVFGVPMSYFGFIYYLYMFALAARLAYDPFSNSLRFRAVLYAGVGAASSMYFMYLQLGFIRQVCIYCLVSAVTSFLLLFAALWHFQAIRHPVMKS
jgi:uncharacterized membrane protein